MRRLGLKVAAKFQGAYHVTSPRNLLSFLKNGLYKRGEGKGIDELLGLLWCVPMGWKKQSDENVITNSR